MYSLIIISHPFPYTILYPYVKKKKKNQIRCGFIYQRRKSRNRPSRLRLTRNPFAIPCTIHLAFKDNFSLPRIHRRPARAHKLQPKFLIKSPKLPFLPTLQKNIEFSLPNRPVRRLRK